MEKLTDRTAHWIDELVTRTKSGLEERFGICYDLMDQEQMTIKIQRRDPEEEVTAEPEVLDLTTREQDVPMDAETNEVDPQDSYYTEEEVELRISTAPDEECEGDEAGRFHSMDGDEGAEMTDHPGV